ncbi:MAG: citramalate synthase, partial [Nitrososphaerales archaeon]
MLDTTLRDGAQTYGISFTLQDKLSITQRLDELGIKYIEGGWPASNPKDSEFFNIAKTLKLKHSEIVAFTSTKKKNTQPDKDLNLKAVISSGVKSVVVFGKAWNLHVNHVLKISLEDNLDIIKESILFLKSKGLNVIFDAEHYFDGYKADQTYALKVLQVAEEAGADTLVLCDTNGGTLPHEVHTIVLRTKEKVRSKLGIHAHNDAGLAVANTIIAVSAGVRHIQGTINGLGERCGNADLCQILPTLHFKMGFTILESHKPRDQQLKGLTALSEYVYELLNLQGVANQPYVGKNAFKHKAGVHIDAIKKVYKAYEHIDPSLIGNERGISISELSGRASIVSLASELNLDLSKDHSLVNEVLK